MIEQKCTPRLLVMAGGTGGHIFPGLAVADELKSRGWHIHWLGTAERMESTIVPAHGYNISYLNISGLRGKHLAGKLTMPFKLLASIFQARAIIKQVNPDVVLGMGGYASGPGGVAAWFMRKPLVVHEQNAAAGLTNRILAKIASIVCCAFPNAFGCKTANRVEVVGNPLRASICQRNTTEISSAESTSKNILVVGGSLGAKILNQVVPKSFKELNSRDTSFNIWHQTGKAKHHEVISAYSCEGIAVENIKITEFIADMASAYQWADIVICRAGALTVSELAMAGKPAIFVPLPQAVDDHQTKNAQFLVSCGGARLLPQPQLSQASLTRLINELFRDSSTLTRMGSAASAAADKNATVKVAAFCQQLLNTK